jgi:hypothetical protein
VVSLEYTVRLSSLGLTVLEVHVVCARNVHGGSSSDLGHDCGSSGIGVNVGALDESLLVGGTDCQLHTQHRGRWAY